MFYVSLKTKLSLVISLQASEYARTRGLPRVFLAANSGARIGMAQSLKKKFQICFMDDRDPSKGFKYIYLSQGNFSSLFTSSVLFFNEFSLFYHRGLRQIT